MKTILVHYRAFDDDQMFVFTGTNDKSLLPESDVDFLLDSVFRECNHVDGTEWIAGKHLRSLSVDDEVIIINDGEISRYRCARIGWEKLSNK